MAPRQAVAAAIQDLVAARLARGFVPAALLFSLGLVELGVPALVGASPEGSGALLLAFGALASAGVMLAHGLRVVQEAFGRPQRAWMTLARWIGALPLAYGLYVLAWRGLRQLAMGGGRAGLGLGIVFAVLGTWVLRSGLRVVEVEGLARLMTFDLEGRGGGA
jgi:hypothetical protein